MIVCPRCAKENQDHYKFCLGCGAELPRGAAQPKSFTAPTPPSGLPAVDPTSPGGVPDSAPLGESPTEIADVATFQPPREAPASAAGSAAPPAFGGAAASAPEPEAPAAPTSLTCPNCQATVPPNFRFCGACGFDMSAVEATQMAPRDEPPPASPMSSGDALGRRVLIRPDGSEGESIPLNATTIVGRNSGGPFANDSFLSPTHAEFSVGGGAVTVRDTESLNGVYVRIAPNAPQPLTDGSVFRIGQEIIKYEDLVEKPSAEPETETMGSQNPGYVGRIRLVVGRETFANTYPVPSTGLHLGRGRGEVILPEDGYVSGLHCRIAPEGEQVMLTDVGSSNGTFVRIVGEASVKSGDMLLLGQQLFRLDL